jgi:hypothetical protein
MWKDRKRDVRKYGLERQETREMDESDEIT